DRDVDGELPEAVPAAVPGAMPGAVPGAMPGAVPGAMIERFDAQRSAARRHVQERIAALARVRIEPRIPGRRYRNVHVACLLERPPVARASSLQRARALLARAHVGAMGGVVVEGERYSSAVRVRLGSRSCSPAARPLETGFGRSPAGPVTGARSVTCA